MRVRHGEIFGFLGPNGSGKTTTIRMMCGLLKPDSGTGTCLGYDIRKDSADIKRNVGYMTQRFSFWDDLTLRENLEFVARIYQLARSSQQSRQIAGGSRPQQPRPPIGRRIIRADGSSEWRWRRACCTSPKLLLLDEPTAGVDPKARRDFWDELQRLSARGISVLVSTHYMDEAVRCHKLAYIAYGKLLAQGSAAEIVASQGLSSWAIYGNHLAQLQDTLRRQPGVDQTVTFGDVLHVSGTDAGLLERTVKTAAEPGSRRAEKIDTSLEDVFIYMMSRAPDNGGGQS
jgi:ABC-2 type transport system ATP-binding protein